MATNPSKKPKVIIDTDVDIDDWMAILYLLNHPGIEVAGLTVVGTGATHLEPGVRNALNLVQLAGSPDLPVAKGLETPMAYDHQFPASIRDEMDNMFGIKLPNNPSKPLPSALTFLREQLESAEEKLTILAIGPLTNLGTLLHESGDLATRIERIFIMGGAIDVPGNVNAADQTNPNVVAEFNIYCDPVAADCVFRSGAPITLIPLDATEHAPITTDFYLRLLQNHQTPSADFVYQALTADYAFIASNDFDFWDPLAAAILTEGDLGSYRSVRLSVHTENDDRSGQLLIKRDGVKIKTCFNVTAPAFEDLFLASLNGEPVPRGQITFILDGDRVTLNDLSPQTRLIDYLHRPEVGKRGTKLVCGQGGCGACTVMLTSYDPGQKKLINRAINACLRPLVGLDGTMVTTTQGIGNVKDGIDEVQYNLAANNGSQCGYCSPGFTMNMFTLRQNSDCLKEKEIEDLFDGNLCRCTGYRPILEAFKQFAVDYQEPCPKPRIKIDPAFDPASIKPFTKIEPPEDFVEYMQNPQPLLFSRDGYTYQRPVTLKALYELKKAFGPTGPNFRLVCGNTSVGIYETQPVYAEPTLDPHYLVDVSVIPELQTVKVTGKGLELGGGITLSRLLEILQEVIETRDKAKTRGLVALRDHVKVVANRQVRNEASLAGNVYLATNLGFLSDVVPVLGTLGATVKVSSTAGRQVYDILNLPKDDQLPQDAIYESFFIPFTRKRTCVRTYKVRRRDEDSHALVNAGFLVRFDKDWRVAECRIVYNGIKADYELQSTTYGLQFHPITVERTRELLKGRAWSEETLSKALSSLATEVAAYEPPRGPAGPYEIGQIPFSFRASLAENLFYKFFVAVADETGLCKVPPEDRSAGETYERPVSSGQQYYNSYPDELPVSDPYVRLSAFLQTTGEAQYTHDMDWPPNTLEAAYVYSLIAFGQYYYKLPITTAHGVKGERVSVAVLKEFLQDWHPDFVSFITYDDIPIKTGNWVGLGGDDPIFVPSLDQQLPDGVEPNKNFYPHHVTCIGAPIGLIVSKNLLAAREIADFVRTQCIEFKPERARSFDEALAEKFYFEQNPPTDPSLTHIPEITRPGGNKAWLGAPEKNEFKEGDKSFPVVSGSRRTGYQNHFYLETMNTIAVPGENRSMTLNTVSQAIADNQYTAAGALGIPAANVQVRMIRAGGGFGGRQSLSHFNSTAAAVAAWVLNQPVRLVLDRNTNFITCGGRHAYESRYAVAYDDDGTLKGLSIDFRSDGGSTYELSLPVMDFSLQSNDNAYNIETYRVGGEVCQTNKLSNTAFRSFGYVQAVNLTEQAIEHVAYKLGKNPEEIREKNLYKDGREEWTGFRITDQTLETLQRLRFAAAALAGLEPIKGQYYKDESSFQAAVEANDPTGAFSGPLNLGNLMALKQYSTTSYDFTPYMEGLQQSNLVRLWQDLKRESEFEKRRAAIAEYNARNRWRKRGISMIPLKYGISYSDSRGTLDQGGAYVVAYSSDGSVLVAHGGVEMGQGMHTKMAQIAAETLGIDITLIKIADTDTNVISDASPTAASTGSDLNGGAVQLACRKLRERLEKFCEDLEQYTVYFSQFDKTAMDVGIVEQMQTVTQNWREHWSEVWPMICSLAYVNRVGLAAEARYKAPNFSSVDISHSIGNTFFYFTYAVAVSEVEVDALTGDFTILRSDILFDVGKSLNPLIDVGQIEGGFVQGVGYLTMEELTYQGPREAPRLGYPKGALTTTNTWEYKPPGARSIPLDLRVRIADTSGSNLQSKARNLDAAAVKKSKGIGEPPLVLSNTVFFAIKQAIQAFYQDQGYEGWVDMDAPATVVRIQSACRVAIDNLNLNPIAQDSLTEHKMIARHSISGQKTASSKKFYPQITGLPPLPKIDWGAINNNPPQLCDTPSGDLPAADIAVITWAESEWAALQQVFVQSDQEMPYSDASKGSWDGWEKYDKDLPAHPNATDWTYWGYYRLVKINNKTVLLFKSNTHLDWPGESYLADLIERFCQVVKPSLILSIGTAGGSRLTDHLGTVNVVNAATMYEQGKPQSEWPKYDNAYSPAWSIIEQSGFDSLLFNIPATNDNLQTLADQFNTFYGTTYPLSTLNAGDLDNGTDPPALNNLTPDHTPLLTASTFVVGTTSGGYADFAVIEMDDAVIAQVCQKQGVEFGFVRNVSDPAENAALPAETQGNWGSAVYDVFGFYTSYNGALATWAMIASMDS
jgi:xanthine dehydrogenase/oxidase